MANVVEKIQALLAKARDSACSEAEAAACMERARKLMDQHGIEEAELGAGAESVDEEQVGMKYLEPWRKVLAMRVAAYYGCSTMFYGGEKKFLLVGRRASREVAKSMIVWLDSVVVRLARDWRKAEGADRKAQLNFERACGGRICERLRQMTEAAVSGGDNGGSGSGSLVLARELDEAGAWMAGRYKLSVTTARSKVGGAGAEAGRLAGGAVSLGGQVGGRGAGGGVRLLG
jgi:hypothetical protein